MNKLTIISQKSLNLRFNWSWVLAFVMFWVYSFYGAVLTRGQELTTVILATAHPAKFSNVVMEAAGINPELPENLKNILYKKEKYKKFPNDLRKIKQFILDEM